MRKKEAAVLPCWALMTTYISGWLVLHLQFCTHEHLSRGILFIVGDGLHHAPGRDPSSFSYSLNLSPPPTKCTHARWNSYAVVWWGLVVMMMGGTRINIKPENSDNFSGFFSICFNFPSKMHIRLSCVIFSKFRFDITLYFLFSCLYSCSLVLEEKEIRVNKKKPYGKI